MKEIIDKKECTGCMACANICSKNAINIQEYCAFQYPIINEEKCINMQKMFDLFIKLC